ncbi:XRE family transcriptional regulator [Leuconostocaceae bacterium ESL0958]|nr:XRE family transcriptional regulator [Leuconostocaceae bacterium ESL0958]
MNNFSLLKQMTASSHEEIAQATGLTVWDLESFEQANQPLSTRKLEALCLYFSNVFDQMGQQSQRERQHPIHLRLSADYLLNLGLTSSDWITLKWALEAQWGNDRLVVGFFDEQGQLVKVIESVAWFIDTFAGYLILALEGQFTPYVDEYHGDVHYDWRLLRYLNQHHFTDITNQIAQTPYQELHP